MRYHGGVEVIQARNINSVFPIGVGLLEQLGVERASRAGPVLEIDHPVITIYAKPQERVLFSEYRDCNPFFHLFESLWMLAGRNDVAFLLKLNKRMKEYSDDGITQHGAYGHRWRHWFDVDQLTALVETLRRDHETRRAVLAMWSPFEDIMQGAKGGKDVPCNTHVYFKIRDGKLMMSVSNRSNDMLWGAYGANVVHMSMLQEYVANKVGVGIGQYMQMSDSFHVYTTGPGGDLWKKVQITQALPVFDPYEFKPGPGSNPWEFTRLPPDAVHMPLDANETWDEDLVTFFGRFDEDPDGFDATGCQFQHPWWIDVALPMWRTYKYRSADEAKGIMAHDWRKAAVEWLERRAK